jgi:hypothetical protein
MDDAHRKLLQIRRAEAARGAAQAAVHIADDDLIEAIKELCEAYHVVKRMIAAQGE